MTISIDTIRIFVHVLAASVWVGGQIVLGALVPTLRRMGGDAPKQAAQAFNRVAWPAFGVAVVTGVWNLNEIGIEDTSSGYQVALLDQARRRGRVGCRGLPAHDGHHEVRARGLGGRRCGRRPRRDVLRRGPGDQRLRRPAVGQFSTAAASRSRVARMVSRLRSARSSTPEVSRLNSMADAGRRSSVHSVTRQPVSVGSMR